mgnify:CR=1 FL=1
MSPEPGTYSLTSPNAVYANKALNHAYWAAGAPIFVMVLHTVAPAAADGLLDAVWGAWMLFEFSQIIRYGIKSLKAGRQDGRVLTFSVREGAFVSIPEAEAR